MTSLQRESFIEGRSIGLGGAAPTNRPVDVASLPAPTVLATKVRPVNKAGGRKRAQLLMRGRRGDAGIVSPAGRRPGLPVEARPADHPDRALGGRRLDRPDGAHRRDGARSRSSGRRSSSSTSPAPRARSAPRACSKAPRTATPGPPARRSRHRQLQGARAPRQPSSRTGTCSSPSPTSTAIARQPERPVQGLRPVPRHAEEKRQERSGRDRGPLLGRPQHDGDDRQGAPASSIATSPTTAAIRRCSSTVSGETQAVAQLLVEMSEMIKGKRLIPLAVQADKPVMLEGYGEIPPVTKWLPNMPAPLNYFGIWAPKGTPEPIVKTMDRGLGEEDRQLRGAQEVRRCPRRSVHAAHTARRRRRRHRRWCTRRCGSTSTPARPRCRPTRSASRGRNELLPRGEGTAAVEGVARAAWAPPPPLRSAFCGGEVDCAPSSSRAPRMCAG